MGNVHDSKRKNIEHYKALVVEDMPIIQNIYRRYLEDLGYQVDIAADGYEALERVAKSEYSCALLDLGLPDISGESVLVAIRYREQETGRHLPIIVNSAHAGRALLERCRKMGADAAFQKPLSPEVLSHLLPSTGTSDASNRSEGPVRR